MIYFIIAFIALLAAWIVIRCLYVPFPTCHTLYFGKPGSGKTMYATRMAYKFRKKHTIFSNYPIALPDIYRIDKSCFGHFSLPEGSVILFDEASLSGFDNRQFKDNFKDEAILDFFKTVRHHKCAIVWTNQGYNELDIKIRTLTQAIYLVKKLPFFSIALRIYFDTKPDHDTGQIEDKYKYANFFRMLFDPRCIQLVFRPKYGRFYNSWAVKKLPPLPLVPWLSPIPEPWPISSPSPPPARDDRVEGK